MPKIKLPVTRYYGSKRKLVERIWTELENLNLEFDTVLDIFGGTGIFSYYAKKNNKRVIYNDLFKFNYLIGVKLIEESSNELDIDTAISLLSPIPGIHYFRKVSENFRSIYYTDHENEQIDYFIQNANLLLNDNQRHSAYYILFQSCIIKRPYNLFHRNNLYMRINHSGGNFGNKITWERSFEELFVRFIKELNEFCFDNGRDNIAVNSRALALQEVGQLVYIDPPYFNYKGNHTTYHAKYHFLEGLAHYDELENHINFEKSNREITINKNSEFESVRSFLDHLKELIWQHRNSIVVVSYRNNGIPSINEIKEIMQQCKPNNIVITIDLGIYGYALNKSNATNSEYLIIGTNTLR